MGALKSLTKRRELAKLILKRLQAVNPDPRCELVYHTPFQLLVSVALSAQTTDKSVNKVMAPLYEGAFTPETVIKLGPDGLLTKIRSIGLAPTKSKNVYKLSQMLLAHNDGEVPESREQLEAANVILGEIFGYPTLAVDTHVFRVTARLGLQREATAEKAELMLLKVVDPADLPAGHHHFILHGRYTCKALSPLCESCVLADVCPSFGVVAKASEKQPSALARQAAQQNALAGKASATRQAKVLSPSKSKSKTKKKTN